MAIEKRISFTAKRMGPQVSEARLKTIVLEPVEERMVVIYELGVMQDGAFTPMESVPTVHIRFPNVQAQKVLDFIDLVDTFVRNNITF